MVVTVQRVEQTSEALVDKCAIIFVELMKDDTALISLCGGEVGLMYPLAHAMISACALEGEYYTATNEDNELVGFCAWMPPGKVIFSTEAQRQLGLDDFMKRLPEIGKEYYKTTYFAEFPQFVAQCLGDPKWKADFWWLHVLMVPREHQKKGVARALLRPVLEKAVKTLEPLALSTTTEVNVPKYTGLGFRLLDNRIMPSPWGEWPLYVFSLDPRTPSS